MAQDNAARYDEGLGAIYWWYGKNRDKVATAALCEECGRWSVMFGRFEYAPWDTRCLCDRLPKEKCGQCKWALRDCTCPEDYGRWMHEWQYNQSPGSVRELRRETRFDGDHELWWYVDDSEYVHHGFIMAGDWRIRLCRCGKWSVVYAHAEDPRDAARFEECGEATCAPTCRWRKGIQKRAVTWWQRLMRRR